MNYTFENKRPGKQSCSTFPEEKSTTKIRLAKTTANGTIMSKSEKRGGPFFLLLPLCCYSCCIDLHMNACIDRSYRQIDAFISPLDSGIEYLDKLLLPFSLVTVTDIDQASSSYARVNLSQKNQHNYRSSVEKMGQCLL